MRIAGAIAGTVLGVAIVLWFWKTTVSAPLLPAPSVSITAERRPTPPASPAPPAVLPQSVTRPPVRAAIVPAAVVTRVDTTRVPAAVVTPVDTARARAATRPVEYVGALTIDSTPAGEVFIDRKPAGRTPMRAEQLKAGSHLIWIQQDGYQRFTRVVQVPADRVTRLVADLERAAR